MMLHLILGRAQSGKTYAIMQTIRELLAQGRQDMILLVPEQFSFESEKNLILTLDFEASGKVEVAGFKRLCDFIGDELGGKAGCLVDDGSRLILMRMALAAVADELSVYGKYRDSNDFALKMIDTIVEMKQSAVSAEFLADLARKSDNAKFRGKINDIVAVMSAYEALLGNTFIDPLDAVEDAVNRLQGKNWFANKTVLIDSFTGFTASQRKFIGKIIAESRDTYISLCADSVEDKSEGTSVFAGVKREIGKLINIAKNNQVPFETIILDKINCETDSVCAVEAILSETDCKKTADDNFKIIGARDVYEEIDFVCSEIRRLVREENYRYRDIIVIARNSEDYDDIMKFSSENYSIPCFFDKRVEMKNLPPVLLVLAAIKASSGFKTDDILEMLKTGLFPVSEKQLCDLENYAYIWSINGNRWLEPWDMSPYGLEEVADKEKAEKELRELEELRQKIVSALLYLKSGMVGSAENMIKVLFCFLEKYEVPHALGAYIKNLKDEDNLFLASVEEQCWDKLMQLFDRLALCFGEQIISRELFCEMLEASLNFETVGDVPQKLDEVVFGAAGRIKPMRPKVVFTIGVNQGVFPAATGEGGGLLTAADRLRLAESGAEIDKKGIEEIIKENFLFYSSVCAGSQKIYISYHENSSEQNDLEAAKPLYDLSSKLNIPILKYEITPDSLQWKKPGFSAMTRFWKCNTPQTTALKKYFAEDEQYKQLYNKISDVSEQIPPHLTSKVAGRLFSGNMNLSASRIDLYHRCKFSYFCKYGLNAKIIKKAEMNVMMRGTIVHYILEKVVGNHKKDINSVADEDFKNEIQNAVKKYFGDMNIPTDNLDDYFKFLLANIEELVFSLLCNIRGEFSQSEFEVAACELPISEDSDIKPLTTSLSDGSMVTVNGIIDRVDIGELCGRKYVRVVDYKTGSKKFDISDTLFGLNLQMLIYLYAVCKDKNLEPAGILYMNVRRSYNEPGESTPSYFKMNGLLNDNEDLLQKMEAGISGRYIPAKLGKGGLFKNSSVIPTKELKLLFRHIERLLKSMGDGLHDGSIEINPLDEVSGEACKYCDYRSICRREPSERNRKVQKLTIEETTDRLREMYALWEEE